MTIIPHHPKSRSGFTIVELLIVIVVIAILAAISIVAYTGIQDRANTAAIQSDMASVGKKLELLRVDTTTWPAPNEAALAAAKIGAISYGVYGTSTSNFLYCGNASTTHYALVARSKSGKTFVYGSNEQFREYGTSLDGLNHSAICTSLTGAGSSRYGYHVTHGWRTWVGGTVTS